MSAFMPFEYCEFRDVGVQLENLDCRVTDLERLPFADESIESVSCMHVVEHIGLGRYGDRLDPDGDIKAMRELERTVAAGGNLLFVVPVGKPKIEYNAHRIYSYDQVVESFPGMRLKQFALIQDRRSDGGIVFDAASDLADQQNFGCGCFWFVKEPSNAVGGTGGNS
jgi:predicted SAM-dependent methyltransferase